MFLCHGFVSTRRNVAFLIVHSIKHIKESIVFSVKRVPGLFIRNVTTPPLPNLLTARLCGVPSELPDYMSSVIILRIGDHLRHVGYVCIFKFLWDNLHLPIIAKQLCQFLYNG